MKDSNLIKVLKSFSKQEWKEFQKFLRSPYYNTNPQIIKLAEILQKIIISGSYEKLDKSLFFNLIYPGKTYSDPLMRKLISLLNKLTEDFISAEKLKSNSILSKRIYIEEMDERNLSSGYLKSVDYMRKWISKEKMNEEMYFEAFQAEYKYSQILTLSRLEKMIQHKQVISKLINFFSYSYFKITAYNLLRENITNEKFDHYLLNELILLLEKDPFKNEIPVQIFKEIVKLYISGDSERIEQFNKVNSLDFEKFLTADDAGYAYFYIQQFLIIQNQKGTPIPDYKAHKWNYYKKYFELLNQQSGGIGETTFGNIINAAIANDETDWVERFIKKHKESLISDDSQTFWQTAYARIKFAKKDFNGALSILSKSFPKTAFMKDLVKVYTLMSLYELERFDEVFNHVQTYRKFVNNSAERLSEPFVKETLDFIKTFELILKAKFTDDPLKLENIKDKLSKNFKKRIMFQNWLENKYKEIL